MTLLYRATETTSAAVPGHATIIDTDLSMGAWSARHAARELASQLGLTLLVPSDTDAENIISAGVDREARGDGTVLTAHADALAIADALPENAVIRVARPRFGLPLRADNRALLRFLAGFGVKLDIRRWGGEGVGSLPPVLQIYPGLVPARVIAAIGVDPAHPALEPLPDDHYRILPAARCIDPRTHPQTADLLARYENGDPRLTVYCQCLGSPVFMDAPALSMIARSLVTTSADLALDLAERARRAARTTLDAATSELQLQGIRIFLHRFDAVAAADDPSIRLPTALRDEMLALKGWGLVMTGAAEQADRCFGGRLSHALMHDAPGAEDLYFLNIAALARLRSGDSGSAHALERRIETILDALPDPDPQLVFVNAINLARLNRAAGNDASYRAYLARAFATSDNVRSLSEALQLNLLLANGAASRDAVRFAWLRAALMWLAAEAPASLGIRAARAALGPNTGKPRHYDARIAAMLLDRLDAHWSVAPSSLQSLPHVALDTTAAALAPTAQRAIDGIALLWSPMRGRRLRRSATTLALAAQVFGVLRTVFPDLPDADSGSWVIDGACACDVRATPADARGSAWRHGLTSAEVEIALGPAVKRVETAGEASVVHFKRHLASWRLERDAARILAHLAERPIASAELSLEDRDVVRVLVDRRVAAVHA